MNRKKLTIAIGAMVLVAGVGIYFSSQIASTDEARRVAEAAGQGGVVTPDQSTDSMRSQSIPQLSSERFEPPPTIATGTYIDPKYRKPAESKEENDVR